MTRADSFDAILAEAGGVGVLLTQTLTAFAVLMVTVVFGSWAFFKVMDYFDPDKSDK